MTNFLRYLFLTITIAFLLESCQKQIDIYKSASLSDYFNPTIGHFIEYRLDSTVFIYYGQRDTVIKYRAKDVVEAAITDNLGQPSYRVVRYLSDTNGVSPWVPAATFMVTPTTNCLEVVDNNLRFQKLRLPVTNGFSWKGNTYFDTYSIGSNVRFMDNWEYMYKDIHQPFTVWNNKVVDSTLTIDHKDETIGFPNDRNSYSERTFSNEVYAKGIGLIAKNILHWEYQPPNGANPGFKTGYGIKLTMIRHQ